MNPFIQKIAAVAAASTLSFAVAAQAPGHSGTKTVTAPVVSPAPKSPAAAAAAQREAGEPRVNTSTAAPASTATTAPSATTVDVAKPQTTSPKTASKGGKNAADRLDLGTTTITGNRELPKVMYVVPWKKADIGDLIGRPANSLLDEVLAPVDRDVFRREVVYYQALNPDGPPKQP